ncbi:protein phosphatase 2C domain-containing protein [Salsuginibacillus halophilus]|nr:protein phosphatase 2C domain-containing protein [Salsuginibacillus halophilus]
MTIEHKVHTNVNIAAYQKEKHGNDKCGDAYVTIETEDYFLCAVADGLGSGSGAHRSAKLVTEEVKKHHDRPIDEVLEQCNRSLFRERGAVVTVLKIAYQSNRVYYGNIGNVKCLLYIDGKQTFQPRSVSGYLAGRRYDYHLETYSFNQSVSFLLFSDGTALSREDQHMVKAYRKPERIVAQLAEKAKSTDDDVTIVSGSVS